MTTHLRKLLLTAVAIFFFMISAAAQTPPSAILTIDGLVERPLKLTVTEAVTRAAAFRPSGLTPSALASIANPAALSVRKALHHYY